MKVDQRFHLKSYSSCQNPPNKAIKSVEIYVVFFFGGLRMALSDRWIDSEGREREREMGERERER